MTLINELLRSKLFWAGILMSGFGLPVVIYALTSWDTFYNSLRYEYGFFTDIIDHGEGYVFTAFYLFLTIAIIGTVFILWAIYLEWKQLKLFTNMEVREPK